MQSQDLKTLVNKYLSDNKIVADQAIKLDPLNDNISSVELIRISGSDLDVVNAARVSYRKISTELTEKDKVLINYLMEHEHTSPFEHNQLSFRIKCPMFVARQWFRHRMNSYNEVSYRYVQAPNEFYIPKSFRIQAKTNKQSSFGQIEDTSLEIEYRKAIAESVRVYEHLINSGVCREQARGVLPMCIYTEFIYTCNLHSFIHFLKLRLNPQAQYEIRVFAQAMLTLAFEHFPVSLDSWFKKQLNFDIFQNSLHNKE